MNRWFFLAVTLLVPACSHRPSFILTNQRGIGPGTALGMISKAPLPKDQNIRALQLQKSENSSVSLIEVRDREQPHIHTRYDLTVVVARGHGTLWMDGKPFPMQEGDAAYIPSGTPHYFVNGGSEPAVAVVTFAPAFTVSDQQSLP